jgi:ABC-type lipopolysaccharide export system ATPase subunit
VLRDVTLEVRAGEIVSVVGSPGAGKTTLLLVAGGRLAPDSGIVRSEPSRLLLIDAPFRPRSAMRFDEIWAVVQDAADSGIGVLVTSRHPIQGEVSRMCSLVAGRLLSIERADIRHVQRARVAEATIPLTTLPGRSSIR